jgi:hypothetical protein
MANPPTYVIVPACDGSGSLVIPGQEAPGSIEERTEPCWLILLSTHDKTTTSLLITDVFASCARWGKRAADWRISIQIELRSWLERRTALSEIGHLEEVLPVERSSLQSRINTHLTFDDVTKRAGRLWLADCSQRARMP